MGVVYLAEHPQIGKKVAIKTLHRKLCTDPELVSRFFQEARAANSIGHPNIVDIADFGETDDGTIYLVMELLSGKTLREQMRRGPVPVARAVATRSRPNDRSRWRVSCSRSKSVPALDRHASRPLCPAIRPSRRRRRHAWRRRMGAR